MYMRLVSWFGRLLRDGSEMELWFGDACVCVCVLAAGNRVRLRRLGSPGAAVGLCRPISQGVWIRLEVRVCRSIAQGLWRWCPRPAGCVRSGCTPGLCLRWDAWCAPHADRPLSPTRGFHRRRAPSREITLSAGPRRAISHSRRYWASVRFDFLASSR